MAAQKDVAASKAPDPTITSGGGDPYPEGTHPARDATEVTHAAANLKYEDMSAEEKPSPSSVAQVQVLVGDEATGG